MTRAVRGPALALALVLAATAAVAGDGEPKTQGPRTETAPGGTVFQELPDRWGIQPPPYALNDEGALWDPYHQNVLKGDRPVWGNDVFVRLTGISKTAVESRTLPVPSGASAAQALSSPFFGEDDALGVDQRFAARFELLKGSTAFKPFDWQLLIEGVANVNHLDLQERGGVDPDVREGTNRTTTDLALEEAFLEIHLLDLSKRYDFLSAKVGRQRFNSDFRSLIYGDVNQGVRLFGTADGNRYQYNLLWFYMAEKDTNSLLNGWDTRGQHVAIANLYVQDFLVLGYTAQVSVHYNRDEGTEEGLHYDQQGFLVRPDPVGAATPHDVDVVYLGWAGEGHLGRLNVSHAFYQALGRDDLNPIAGREIDINAQLAFLELSVDSDWMRYQASVLFASGDHDPRDSEGRGFDTILDHQKVLGGEFSYWNRSSIRIADRGGVALMQPLSFVPDLRSNKVEGQTNFVNPGIWAFNLGATAELTPTSRVIGNVNYLRFVDTTPLEILLKQPGIRRDLGVDVSLGVEYRPLLSNNVIVKSFGALFVPVGGFKDVYKSGTLYQAGLELILTF